MAAMRIGGLASGMDIDTLVEKLMVAERMPMDKLEQQKQIYEWQRDAYRDVNKKMTTLDNYIADNFILKSLNTKTATSSNSDLISAVATGAASGTLSIEGVSQLAKAARGVSDVPVNATGTTKLSELGITGTSISLKAIQADGKMATKATEITFDENTTISQFISKINGSNAGVTAIFESGKLSITAKNTGDYKDGAEVSVESGADVFGKLGFSSLIGKTEGILAQDGTNARFEVNGIPTERTTNAFSINGYNITLKSTFNEGATLIKAAEDSLTTAKENLKSTLKTLAFKYNVTPSEDDTIENQIKAVRDAITSKISDEDPLVSAEAEEAQKLLTTSETNYTNAKEALDDLITNKPETTNPTTTVTMTSSTNVDEIIGKVKEFVATYNGFIKDLTDQTKQAKYRDFKPLTTLQKKEMETKEIEQWEERAKSGLLKSDSILTSGLSSLRGLVYQTNHAVTNQKYNALFTIGIGTSKDYNSGGTLEIDETKLRKALEEDPDAVVQLLTMSGEKSATVTKADGTTVQSDTRGFMRKIRDEMDAMEKKIDERAGRGSMADTQYTLGKYLRNVNQSLDAWQDKLTAIESRYWKQFGAMEAMINKANSQSASLMSQYS